MSPVLVHTSGVVKFQGEGGRLPVGVTNKAAAAAAAAAVAAVRSQWK
jgi:hypothetical protein